MPKPARPLLAFLFVPLLAGCEQPVRAAPNPAPLQAAAEQLDVSPGTLVRLEHGVSRLEARYLADGGPGFATSPPDPSSPEVQRLRAGVRLLELRYTSPGSARP